MRRSVSFSGIDHHHQKCEDGSGPGDDDLSDDASQLGEKKKRLNLEQVKALEKSFELGNKLEPERKLQLARALGLQPRQIAIWFQNRRARWKTKQLERDYEVLKKQCDALKADNENLQAQNEKLHNELLALKRRNTTEAPSMKREIDQGSWGNNESCENSSEINLDLSRTSVMSSPISSSHLSNSKHALPPSSRPLNLPRPDLQHCLKMDHPIVQEENLICNMFNGIDDHQNFWSWGAATEQHQFN
ncbi:hypothetical protein CDL15_Pgr025604 [Punica granatum]|nr:hypothetical protein CDL15_Pgr025604 [Punica granatum]